MSEECPDYKCPLPFEGVEFGCKMFPSAHLNINIVLAQQNKGHLHL